MMKFTNFFKILWGAYKFPISVPFQPFQLISWHCSSSVIQKGHFISFRKTFPFSFFLWNIWNQLIDVHLFLKPMHFFVLFCRILRCGRHRPIRLPGPPGRPWWALASRPWGRATGRAALGGPQCECPWWGRVESPLMAIQVRRAGFCIFVKYLWSKCSQNCLKLFI